LTFKVEHLVSLVMKYHPVVDGKQYSKWKHVLHKNCIRITFNSLQSEHSLQYVAFFPFRIFMQRCSLRLNGNCT